MSAIGRKRSYSGCRIFWFVFVVSRQIIVGIEPFNMAPKPDVATWPNLIAVIQTANIHIDHRGTTGIPVSNLSAASIAELSLTMSGRLIDSRHM